jgi:two-component system, OmpR family, response regulator
MTRILIVEDDAKISQDLRQNLEANNYLVETCMHGEKAWFKGDVEDYAAIILDLGLPALDGLTILKRWRANKRATPVLILTARGTWSERVEGIDAGADDYLVKPFQMEELLARLRALIRRNAGLSASYNESGGIAVDERQMRITLQGIPLVLSSLEYRLIAYLMRHQNRVVPQSELIEHVYAHDCEPSSNALEVLIGRVRRKIGSNFIETRRGFGYCVKTMP